MGCATWRCHGKKRGIGEAIVCLPVSCVCATLHGSIAHDQAPRSPRSLPICTVAVIDPASVDGNLLFASHTGQQNDANLLDLEPIVIVGGQQRPSLVTRLRPDPDCRPRLAHAPATGLAGGGPVHCVAARQRAGPPGGRPAPPAHRRRLCGLRQTPGRSCVWRRGT